MKTKKSFGGRVPKQHVGHVEVRQYLLLQLQRHLRSELQWSPESPAKRGGGGGSEASEVHLRDPLFSGLKNERAIAGEGPVAMGSPCPQ